MTEVLLDRRKPVVDREVEKTMSVMSTTLSASGASGARVWGNMSSSPGTRSTASPTSARIRVRVTGKSLPAEVVIEDGKLTFSEPEITQAVQVAQWLRDALGLSMSQLASLAGVTRAAAYAWFKGTSPHASKAKNLLAMRAALMDVDPLRLRFVPQVWDYPMSDGRTLFKILQELDAPEDAPEKMAGALEFVRLKLDKIVHRSVSKKPGNELGSSHTADIYRNIGPFEDR